jgi:signal transduction histidine kinase
MRADRDETGAIVGFSKITRDATHQPDVSEPSGDWANQAAKIETVGRLAGKVAHEFNNILAVVSGNLELAQKRLKSQRPVEHLLGNAMAAAAKAAGLTSLMLACARRQTLRPGPVNLISLADRVAQDAAAPVRIDLSATETVPFALADSTALEKALAALITNAV